MPTFTFIIPVKPNGVIKALEALRQLKENIHPFEILVAEGTQPSRQRNLAARQSNGDILYFLDDDSQVTSDCLIQCANALETSNVAVVGGPSLTPDNDSRLQRLFGVALSSSFGSGSFRNRYRSTGFSRETTERELILCNLAIHREAFLAAGGFDERLYPNEENELLDRIRESGHKLMHVPSMWVLRSQRSSLSAFVRQMFSYGRGRAQQTLIAGPRTPMNFIPLAFVIYLVLLPLHPSALPWKLPLIAYLTLDALFTAMALITIGNPMLIFLFFIFPIIHCTNGIGLLYGFLRGRRQTSSPADVKIKRIKEFGQTTW